VLEQQAKAGGFGCRGPHQAGHGRLGEPADGLAHLLGEQTAEPVEHRRVQVRLRLEVPLLEHPRYSGLDCNVVEARRGEPAASERPGRRAQDLLAPLSPAQPLGRLRSALHHGTPPLLTWECTTAYVYSCVYSWL
jgi:hypothetical protein